MSDRFAGIVLALAIVAIGIPGPLQAQGLTGQISGTITDESGAVLPGVTVVIKNVGTALTRETVTGHDGAFQFPDLLAGTFDLTVTMQGFKTYEQKGIALASTDRLRLRTIALAIGGLTETVTVQAEAVQVQTSNGARSGLITRQNLEDIALKGRDFAGMLKLLPGVIDTRNREAPGWENMLNLSINGRASFNYTYDGVTNKDTGQNAANFASPALDSIAEVRVQASNFQAEYGRSSGATISVITRSGSKDFHGSAAYYKRDTAWNGNEYSRRILCNQGQTAQCDPPLYQYDNPNWTLGGPVLVPGTGFNKSRSKLFFFWSQEFLSRTDPGNLTQRRMPTALERQGDFSQTVDNANRLIFIRDPRLTGNCAALSGGPACFPGNVIPANRIDANARALLNLFPLPNATDPTGTNQYNYVFQTKTDRPRNDQVARIDWNISPDTTAYGRLQFGYERQSGGAAILGSSNGWPQMATKYEINTVSYVNTLLHTFSPTLYGEVTVGVNWSHQNTTPFDNAARDANDRRLVLPGMPQFFPQANPLNIIPQASFAGLSGVPNGNIGSFNIEQRFGFFGFNTLFNASGNLTKVKGPHTMKAGVFFEHTTRPAARSSSFNGNFNFGTDASNPLNTNVGFANALLGAITSYTESDGHLSAHGLFMITEWYAQDNWRVKRNFTVDAGVRFYYMTPTQSQGDQIPQFEPSEWNSAQAARLYTPVLSQGSRLALNPLTGEILPAVYIGRLVPGSGNFTNGMHVYDGTPQSTNPFRAAPRFGFAWDITGDGKTAMRGGAGVFYDRYQDDNILDLIELPPVLNTYTTNYTTISDLLSSPLSATPSAVRRIEPFTPPVVYNWSLGVQRDIGFNLIADAAYVGNAARHNVITVDLNGRPYGYTFLPSSLDPTNVVGGQARPQADDFLRPYQGFGRIQQRQFSGYSDYHALQFSVNRRRSSDGLSVGASYTYQVSNKSLGTIDPFVDNNAARNYTQNGRRPHVLVINYSYDVPNLSQKWNNLLTKAVFDNWQFSGVTTITSGTYGGFSYNFGNVPTGVLLGTGTGAINGGASRVVITCDPNLPRGERTFERQFNTECIAPPTDQFLLGTSTNDEYLGPGYMNWDISAFKSVRLGGTRRLQLRVELYNAFNTEQWTGVNTNATFDFTTHALTNANTFGRLNGNTNSARRIQLGARFTF